MAQPERKGAKKYGIHRVLAPVTALPQAAERLDNSLPIYANEILIRVERLNIDAASFVQMEEQSQKDPAKIAKIVEENCRARGKQQNQATGSGGMLIGRVEQIGSRYDGVLRCKVGDRVASLVSLTLTPLHLDRITKVHLKNHQIEAEGHAILFDSSVAAVLPKDLDQNVAMAAFDVCGAAPHVYSLCKKKSTLIMIGAGGKAGLLSCVAARRKMGRSGKIIAVEPFREAAQDLRKLKVCDEVLQIDARDPVAVLSGVERATRGKMGDVVVNVASVANTETGTLLSARPRGTVLFFSMATSFSTVTLGSEGIACTARILFGNGYYPNHGKFTLDLLRSHSLLKELFYRRYAN